MKNRKGFTLVELLAVIVILALLIVVTITTVLPRMNSAKKNSMAVFAGRAVQAAIADYQQKALEDPTLTTQTKDVTALVSQSNYYGTIVFDGEKFTIKMASADGKLCIIKTDETSQTFVPDDVNEATIAKSGSGTVDQQYAAGITTTTCK